MFRRNATVAGESPVLRMRVDLDNSLENDAGRQARQNGAEIVAHVHIETKGLSKEQLEHITLSGIYSRIQTKSFLASL